MFRKFLYSCLIILSVSCDKQDKKKQVYPDTSRNEKISLEKFGKELFENKGNCAACHQPRQKIIGPSIAQIAVAYREKGGDIVSFLKGNEKPLVEPEQFALMQANLNITKNMSDDELNAIEAYIISFR